MIARLLCFLLGHRWRPPHTIGLAPASKALDWRDGRGCPGPCRCLRCGLDRDTRLRVIGADPVMEAVVLEVWRRAMEDAR